MDFKKYVNENPNFLNEIKKCDTKEQVEKLLKENHLDISAEEVGLFLNGTRNDLLDGEDLENVSGGVVKSTANKTWDEINSENIAEKKVLTLGEFCSAYGIDLTSKKGRQVVEYMQGEGLLVGGDNSWYKYE